MTTDRATPAERLAASRERLRQAMASVGGDGAGSGDAGSLFDLLGSGWAQHPLGLAAEVGRAALTPVAQRRPRTLVLLAALAGAAVVWARPWRGALRSAIVAGLVPVALKAAQHLPIGFWRQLLQPAARKG